MKHNAIALALTLALLGTLAACGTDRNNAAGNGGNNAGTNSTNAAGSTGKDPAGSGAAGSGVAGSGTAGSGSAAAGSTASSNGTRASAGQVTRRNDGAAYTGRTYWADGRYTAGSNGKVYDNGDDRSMARDLTRDARDIVRDTGDAIGDVGRDIGDMISGNGAHPGTPSWEPDSSAVRY